MNTPTKEEDWIPMTQLCWTGTTLYGVDAKGRVWYIEMRGGEWALHGNPTLGDLRRIKPEME